MNAPASRVKMEESVSTVPTGTPVSVSRASPE